MADSADNLLELLIRLNLVGAENADKARQLLSDIKKESSDSAEGMGELSQSMEGASENTSAFAMHGREVHVLLHEMNTLVPGLGTAMRALFNPATLGVTALVLALELVIDRIKEQREEAAAAQRELGEYLDKFRDATREVLQFQYALNAALREAREGSPTSRYSDELRQKQAVLDAEIKGQKEVNKVLEENETKGAQSEEQKQAIKEKYAAENRKLDDFAENRRTELQRNTIEDIQSEIDARKQANDAMVEEMKQAEKDQNMAAIATIQDRIKKNFEAMKELEGEASRMEHSADNAEAVRDTHKSYEGQADAFRRKQYAKDVDSGGIVDEGVAALRSAERNGGKVDDHQRAAITALSNVYEKLFGNTQHLMEAVGYAHQKFQSQDQEILTIKNQLAALTAKTDRVGQ